MKKFEEILNVPCELSYKLDRESIVFNGLLTCSDGNIDFIGRTKSDIRSIQRKRNLVLCGYVDATEITLLNATIKSGGVMGFEGTCSMVKISPAEIIIGRMYECNGDDVNVKKISANIQVLNNMFSTSPLKLISNFSKEQPSLVEFTYPDSIDIVDDEGTLSIYQTIGMGWSSDSVDLPILAYIDYTYNTSASLYEAIEKLASIRNLFSFFADYYIPLENIIFSDYQSEEEWFSDCAIYLNFSDKIDVSDKPFLVTTKNFANNFDEVWEKWSAFYSKKYIPTLFYEVICNRSTGINKFLNLAQTIEIFSVNYRDKEARALAKSAGCNWKIIPLKYRIEDIFTYLNDYLELSRQEIKDISKRFSDARNFFTHYDEKNGIPTFQEMSSAGRVLHFALLALVYKTIALSNECIKESATRFSCGSLFQDIQVVLGQDNDAGQDNMFD